MYGMQFMCHTRGRQGQNIRLFNSGEDELKS